MTPADIRKLADFVEREWISPPDCPLNDYHIKQAASSMRACADVYEQSKDDHKHAYPVNGCSGCDALARVEALKP